MAGKEYQMSFVLGAKQNAEFSKVFQAAQKEINALNKAQSDITAYERTSAAAKKTKETLELYQKQLDNIQKEMGETEGYSSKLANSELAKSRQIETTNQKLEEQLSKLGRLETSLETAGIDTRDLGKAQGELASKINELRATQEDEIKSGNAFNESIKSGGLESVIAAAGITKMVAVLKEFASAAAESAIMYESAIAGVAKTTDFTESELAEFADELQRVSSTEIPAAAAELAGVAETAGQLGIAKENLLSFTEVMTKMGIATNLTSEEAATELAKFANITGMSADNFERLGSVVVALGNNFATTERDIVSMSKNLAAAGDIVGLSEANIAALSTTLSSLGIEAQMGGTAISKLMREFETMVATQSEKLEKFAQTAGMSAAEFSRAWDADAMSTLSRFIDGLGAMEASGKSSIATLDELGITEARQVDAISRLANSEGLLSKAVEMSNKAWSDNNALSEEAAKRFATTESQSQLAANAYTRLQIAIGEAYTPVLRTAYETQQNIFNGLAQFAEEQPEVTRALTIAVGVFGTATAGLAAYTAVSKLAAIATATLNVSLGPIVGIIGAVAGAIALLTFAADKLSDEEDRLTASWREQEKEIKRLRGEYEDLQQSGAENSAEAVILKRRIDELSDAFEANKQTVNEAKEAHDALINAYKAEEEAYRATMGEISGSAERVEALSAKLRELGATTESAASHQSEIKAVISALNEELPGLALNYDDVIERTAKYTGGLDAAARAIRRQREEEAQLAAYQSKLDLEISLKKEKEAREADVAAAKKQVEASKKVYDAALSEVEGKKNYSQRIQSGLAKERSAYESASRELAIYEAQLAEVNGSISANAAAMEEMNAAWVAMESETESAEGMASAIDAVSGKISELAARYQEAYDAAKASVDGQYEIWDKAATIAPVKASQIGAALESQFAYWEKYNSNLESLYSRTSGIDGLNEFLASFADGSAESVNVIAGLSTADDATLRKAIDTWNKVRAQEEKVENSLANMATDFKNATAEIQSELETRVAEMDLSEAAMENGKATIEGFIEGASEMLPEVQEAYGKLGAAAMLALGENQRIRILTGSPQSGYYGEIPGYAGGTTDAPEAFIAGEAGPELILGARGASVFPHTETRRIIEAAASDYSYAGARITLSPVYNISGFDSSEVSGALSEQNEALREIIRDALLEIENNKRRLAYK